jgi:hypothetical protein
MATELDTAQTVISTSTGHASASAIAGLGANARTVTGSNLKGTVKIVSLKELQASIEATLQAQAAKEADLIAKARAQEAQARHALEQKWTAENNALHQRISELEARLKEAEAAKLTAVEQAKADGAKRIKELEHIIASDDARTRVVFLEKEVARLAALVDRYEAGLEFVTALERPDISEQLATAESLKATAPAPLAARLDQIIVGLQAAARAVDEGLVAVNAEKKGTVYGVTDLLEQSLALVHLRNEVISIQQAMGKG